MTWHLLARLRPNSLQGYLHPITTQHYCLSLVRGWEKRVLGVDEWWVRCHGCDVNLFRRLRKWICKAFVVQQKVSVMTHA